MIRVGSAGVNPVDTYIRMGLFAQLPTLPYIPGLDGSGTIEKIGSLVDTLKVCSINPIFKFSLTRAYKTSKNKVSRLSLFKKKKKQEPVALIYNFLLGC